MYLRVGFCVFALLVLSFGAASAQMGLHWTPQVDKGFDNPGNGAVWHEIYPTFCNAHTQTNFIDNGNGELDACDEIVLTDEAGTERRYHIEAVNWTYVMHVTKKSPPVPSLYFDSPLDPDQNHVGASWHQIYPDDSFCNSYEVTVHEDYDNNGIDPGDFVDLSLSGPYIIDHVGIDIEVGPGTAVESGAWGKIKAIFGDLF